MKVLISGVTGFLGSSLARHFLAAGCKVAGACRSPQTAHLPAGVELHAFDLRRSCEKSMLNATDVLVHCAHDFGPAGAEANRSGTLRLCEIARREGVQRQIFISSYSARPDAMSEYANTKYELENCFLAAGEIVIRPGLVIGYGGMFARTMDTVLRARIVPLLDGGRDRIPLIALEDFLRAAAEIIKRGPGAYNLFIPELPTMRDIATTLNRIAGHRALFLPIPTSWAAATLRAGRKLGLRLPFEEGNITALKQNRQCIHTTDLPDVASGWQALAPMLEAAIVARVRSSLDRGCHSRRAIE